MKIKVGLVDDHELFLRSVGLMLSSYDKFNVVLEALNGVDLQEKIAKAKNLPDIMLVDVNMPKMNGYETVCWLRKKYPSIKLVALSMNDNDRTIIEMLKAGCCAYLLKDTHPDDLDKALVEVYEKGYYNGDATNINFRRLLIMTEKDSEELEITEVQKAFMQLCCTDLTYRQIASQLGISEN